MYDSDEVRDAVRGEFRKRMRFLGQAAFDLLSPWEIATIDVVIAADEAERRLHWERLTQAFQNLYEALLEWGERLVQAVMEGLGDVGRQVTEICKRLAIQIGLVRDGSQVSPAQRRAWRRQTDCQPVRLIDDVAARRHPAMIFRARRVGGRR